MALGEKLGLPVVHLDQLWWKEGWRNVTREEFDSRLAMAMNMDGWIIDGNYSRTMEMRLAKCDTVIYLDFNRWACLRGMCQRVFGNYGKVRPDMAQGCPERFDPSFVKWIWDYNKNNRVQNYMYLAKTKPPSQSMRSMPPSAGRRKKRSLRRATGRNWTLTMPLSGI